MENLGYGTHFTVDGFQTGGSVAPAGAAAGFLRAVADYLEPSASEPFQVSVAAEDGESAALLSSETQLLLHLFPELRSVSLQVFTRRDVSLTKLMQLLEQSFAAGRFESHLGNVARAAPRDRNDLQQMVQGDRAYARARLVTARSG